MWIGIVVLCTFSLIALAALALAGRAAFERQWHIAIALLVPALGLGGPIAMLAGPTAWISVFGNPDLKDLPATATRLSHDELAKLFTGHAVVGMYYQDGTWLHFREEYHLAGDISGTGGPDDDPTKLSWDGSWKIAGDQMCWKYDQDFACNPVYADGDRYDSVNGRNEIESWFKPAKASVSTQ